MELIWLFPIASLLINFNVSSLIRRKGHRFSYAHKNQRDNVPCSSSTPPLALSIERSILLTSSRSFPPTHQFLNAHSHALLNAQTNKRLRLRFTKREDKKNQAIKKDLKIELNPRTEMGSIQLLSPTEQDKQLSESVKSSGINNQPNFIQPTEGSLPEITVSLAKNQSSSTTSSSLQPSKTEELQPLSTVKSGSLPIAPSNLVTYCYSPSTIANFYRELRLYHPKYAEKPINVVDDQIPSPHSSDTFLKTLIVMGPSKTGKSTLIDRWLGLMSICNQNSSYSINTESVSECRVIYVTAKKILKEDEVMSAKQDNDDESCDGKMVLTSSRSTLSSSFKIVDVSGRITDLRILLNILKKHCHADYISLCKFLIVYDVSDLQTVLPAQYYARLANLYISNSTDMKDNQYPDSASKSIWMARNKADKPIRPRYLNFFLKCRQIREKIMLQKPEDEKILVSPLTAKRTPESLIINEVVMSAISDENSKFSCSLLNAFMNTLIFDSRLEEHVLALDKIKKVNDPQLYTFQCKTL